MEIMETTKCFRYFLRCYADFARFAKLAELQSSVLFLYFYSFVLVHSFGIKNTPISPILGLGIELVRRRYGVGIGLI